MVKYSRLVKLHVEFDRNKFSKLQVNLFHKTLLLELRKSISNYLKNHKAKYPIPFRDLIEMVGIYSTDTDYYVGIIYDFLKGKDRLSYLKVLDVEFGVNGVEQRVLRRALETSFINL